MHIVCNGYNRTLSLAGGEGAPAGWKFRDVPSFRLERMLSGGLALWTQQRSFTERSAWEIVSLSHCIHTAARSWSGAATLAWTLRHTLINAPAVHPRTRPTRPALTCLIHTLRGLSILIHAFELPCHCTRRPQ